MSTPVGSSQWMYATAAGFYPYLIDQSLRFNDDDGAYLSKTYSTTQTNDKLITVSVWFKLGNLKSTSGRAVILHARNGGAGEIRLQSDKLQANCFDTGYVGFRSEGLFRDTAAWYHIVYQGDSTNATASDRNRVWLNGQELTNAATSFPPQNQVLNVLKTGQTTMVGRNVDNAAHDWDGYLAEMHVIDGSLVDATSFGETINGIWVPKAYSGSYGTNGFYLSFADSSAIGDDLSGNTNDFTANNLAASDIVPDSPTNNFSTFNNLYVDADSTPTYSEGNLRMDATSTSWFNSTSTFIQASGKWYAEFYISNVGTGSVIAIGTEKSSSTFLGSDSNAYGYHSNGNIFNAGTGTAYGDTFTTGDVIGVALDLDGGNVYFYKNGTIQNSGTAAATGLTGEWFVGCSTSGSSGEVRVNFGQDATFAGGKTSGSDDASDDNGQGTFYETPPSGYLALVSANLPEVTIGPNSTTTSDQYFNTVLYTGTGATQSVAGVGFGSAPDFTWIKSRSSTYNNVLWDTVRGATQQLSSNTTGAESTQAQGLTSFDSDGFTLGTNSNLNNSGTTYASWNWKAGGTAVSNTDGSITSQVSAAPDAGFSIVSYTGTGANATVGHGLSSAPDMIIAKGRSTAGRSWAVYHSEIASDAETDYLLLNSTAAAADNNIYWNDTAPTSSVFSVGTASNTNQSSVTFIAYCFHSVDGYSKVGSYVGNANADGTFVYTGFRPAFVLLKKSSAAGDNWSMYDNKRDTDNTVREYLIPNQSAAAASTDTMDFVSNGFKVRNSGAYINTSGATYIYLAFAEAPFKYANAR